jgi:hypothetical protein
MEGGLDRATEGRGAAGLVELGEQPGSAGGREQLVGVVAAGLPAPAKAS